MAFFKNAAAFYLKHGGVLKKHRGVSNTHPTGYGTNSLYYQKKAKKYSYFFANSSNVLPSNWQIAFL